jgi:hypothetical protein
MLAKATREPLRITQGEKERKRRAAINIKKKTLEKNRFTWKRALGKQTLHTFLTTNLTFFNEDLLSCVCLQLITQNLLGIVTGQGNWVWLFADNDWMRVFVFLHEKKEKERKSFY